MAHRTPTPSPGGRLPARVTETLLAAGLVMAAVAVLVVLQSTDASTWSKTLGVLALTAALISGLPPRAPRYASVSDFSPAAEKPPATALDATAQVPPPAPANPRPAAQDPPRAPDTSTKEEEEEENRAEAAAASHRVAPHGGDHLSQILNELSAQPLPAREALIASRLHTAVLEEMSRARTDLVSALAHRALTNPSDPVTLRFHRALNDLNGVQPADGWEYIEAVMAAKRAWDAARSAVAADLGGHLPQTIAGSGTPELRAGVRAELGLPAAASTALSSHDRNVLNDVASDSRVPPVIRGLALSQLMREDQQSRPRNPTPAPDPDPARFTPGSSGTPSEDSAPAGTPHR